MSSPDEDDLETCVRWPMPRRAQSVTFPHPNTVLRSARGSSQTAPRRPFGDAKLALGTAETARTSLFARPVPAALPPPPETEPVPAPDAPPVAPRPAPPVAMKAAPPPVPVAARRPRRAAESPPAQPPAAAAPARPVRATRIVAALPPPSPSERDEPVERPAGIRLWLVMVAFLLVAVAGYGVAALWAEVAPAAEQVLTYLP